MVIAKAWYVAGIMEWISHVPVRHESGPQQGCHFFIDIRFTLCHCC
jgi:hypothetical protein